MSRLVSENNIKIRVYKNKIMIKDGFNMLEKDMSSESKYTRGGGHMNLLILNGLHERRGKHM